VVANNLIYDPGQKSAHYNLIAEEWGDQPRQVGSMAFIGNVMRAGPSTRDDLAFFALGGSGDMDFYAADNIAVDRLGRPMPMTSRYTTSGATLRTMKSAPVVPFGWTPLKAADVQDAVIKNVGARPWDRDHHDSRVVADTIEARGKIIDSEQEVGGYPEQVPSHAPFDEAAWDLRFMTRK
jgi:hypothetical protein